MLLFCLSCLDDVETKTEQTPVRINPNVVLVVIDTLRTDHITEEISPNLVKMAASGIQYTNTWATSSWTAPSTASIATGMLTSEHGIYRGMVASAEQSSGQTIQLNTLSKDIPTLAEKLKAVGYHTYGLASNVNIDSGIGFDRGFDEFLCAPEEHAHKLFEKIDEWKPKEPYFLYLHLNDIHSPYEPRAPWYQKKESTHADMIAAYDSEISYLDNELAKLYQKMNWQKNLLLITADHGEEFMDHGQSGHLETLYRELTHVIFWMSGPGIPQRSVNVPLSLADTHHILLNAIDVAKPPPPRPVISHRVGKSKEIWSLTTKEWRWIEGELYRISDSKEQSNLASQHPEIESKLRQEVAGIRKEIGRRKPQFKQISLKKDNVDLLKQLGYIE